MGKSNMILKKAKLLSILIGGGIAITIMSVVLSALLCLLYIVSVVIAIINR